MSVSINKASKQSLIINLKPLSHVSEAYRSLRTKIMFLSSHQEIKKILVTSSQMKEGKTLTTANLAVAFAQENKRVLIIDADIRNPSMHNIFQKSNQFGLTNILSNKVKVLDAILPTEIPNLSIITSGTTPSHPSELISSIKMHNILDQIVEKFDLILIDSPPTLAIADSQILSALCDGVVFVVSQGKIKRQVVKKALLSLKQMNAYVLGVVLNNVKMSRNDSSYYYNS